MSLSVFFCVLICMLVRYLLLTAAGVLHTSAQDLLATDGALSSPHLICVGLLTACRTDLLTARVCVLRVHVAVGLPCVGGSLRSGLTPPLGCQCFNVFSNVKPA